MIQLDTQNRPVQQGLALQGELSETKPLFQGSFLDVLLPSENQDANDLPTLEDIFAGFLDELKSFLEDLGLEITKEPKLESPEAFLEELYSLLQEEQPFPDLVEGLQSLLEEKNFSFIEVIGQKIDPQNIHLNELQSSKSDSATESATQSIIQIQEYALVLKKENFLNRTFTVQQQVHTLQVFQEGKSLDNILADPTMLNKNQPEQNLREMPNANKNNELTTESKENLQSKFVSFSDRQGQENSESSEKEPREKKQNERYQTPVFEGVGSKAEAIASFASPKTVNVQVLEMRGETQSLPQAKQHPVVHQVVQKMEVMVQSGKQQMVLQLNPGHLGQVEIRIEMDQDQLTMKVKVENDQVKQILETHAPQLKESLESQNINLEKVEISSEHKFAKGQGKQQQQEPQHASTKGTQFQVEQERVDEQGETGRRLGYNTMEYLA